MRMKEINQKKKFLSVGMIVCYILILIIYYANSRKLWSEAECGQIVSLSYIIWRNILFITVGVCIALLPWEKMFAKAGSVFTHFYRGSVDELNDWKALWIWVISAFGTTLGLYFVDKVLVPSQGILIYFSSFFLILIIMLSTVCMIRCANNQFLVVLALIIYEPILFRSIYITSFTFIVPTITLCSVLCFWVGCIIYSVRSFKRWIYCVIIGVSGFLTFWIALDYTNRKEDYYQYLYGSYELNKEFFVQDISAYRFIKPFAEIYSASGVVGFVFFLLVLVMFFTLISIGVKLLLKEKKYICAGVMFGLECVGLCFVAYSLLSDAGFVPGFPYFVFAYSIGWTAIFLLVRLLWIKPLLPNHG